MVDDADTQIATLAASVKSGSIVAAAGYGKTEQIARATRISEGRRLILTHTHAGVDAVRARLKKHNVPSSKFRIDTIAGWCLRYAASFPKRSGLACSEPHTDKEWNDVYEAASKLLSSGAVNGVITSSYDGVFVDEYQDCNGHQHAVIKALKVHMPVCVFGDPLQAIFDFKGQEPVDWQTDVFPAFAKAGELTTPWRWREAKNDALAAWLVKMRQSLEAGGNIDLTSRPACVNWVALSTNPKFRSSKIVGTCKSVMGKVGSGQLVVIGDAANINSRAALAQKLAAVGFSTIEPLGCKNLYAAAKKLEAATGMKRLEVALDFICSCMTGAGKKAFLNAVKSQQNGGKLGTAKFGVLVKAGIAVMDDLSDQSLLELIQGFGAKEDTRLFRREMFSAMSSALRIKCVRQSGSLADAIWEVQNRIRHTGRAISKRSIGSTLLVKGLEFDHAVIVHADDMTRKDWYVALTRATTTLTVLSPSERFTPAG